MQIRLSEMIIKLSAENLQFCKQRDEYFEPKIQKFQCRSLQQAKESNWSQSQEACNFFCMY